MLLQPEANTPPTKIIAASVLMRPPGCARRERYRRHWLLPDCTIWTLCTHGATDIKVGLPGRKPASSNKKATAHWYAVAVIHEALKLSQLASAE
jgi:hypothetical protein